MVTHRRTWGLAVALLASTRWAHAAPVQTLYVVEEEDTRWEPIDRVDVQTVIEHAALEVLTRAGLLQLVKVKPEELAKTRGDYLLRVLGRMVNESETHTIHLSFEARDRTELGSFRAADTVVIGKLPREVMRQRIEVSTRAAAERLAAVLRPALLTASLEPSLDQPAPPSLGPDVEPPTLPWSWGDVLVPSAPKGDMQDLWGKNEQKRQQMLRELTSEALADAGPRHVLERCALEHPEPEVRLQCLIALRPLARRLAPTQRVVIAVFRKDEDNRVLEEAGEQMTYFTGMSHAESVQAWLERTASDGTQRGPVKELGDAPNLDLVIARCLWNSRKLPEYARTRRSCIELVEPLPGARRRALLWRYLAEPNKASPYYLKGAGPQERSTGTDWQWGLEAVVQTSCKLDTALEDVVWRRYERDLSATAIEVLADYGEPNERVVGRLVQALQTGGERAAASGLLRLAKLSPALLATIRDKVAELELTGSYHKGADLKHLSTELTRLHERAGGAQ